MRISLIFPGILALSLVACGESHDEDPSTDMGSMITFDARPDLGPPDLGPPDLGEQTAVGQPCTEANEETACFDGACIADDPTFPGGYCTRVCGGDEDCPSTAICVPTGGGQALCLDRCDPNATDRQCREGYGCAVDSDLPGVCIGGCSDNTDCPMGTMCDPDSGLAGTCYTPGAVIGQACRTGSQCQEGGDCIDEPNNGFPGGACIGGACNLTSGAGCGADGACAPLAFGNQGICLDACNTTMDCRAGYDCITDSTYPTRKYCYPGCTDNMQCTGGRVCYRGGGICTTPFINGQLGDACSTFGGGGNRCTGGSCLRESQSGFPGSMCTYYGCTVGPDAMDGCPDNGVCSPTRDGTNFCVDACTAPGNCRTGYACKPVDATNPMSPTGCMPACTSDAQCTNTRQMFVCNEGTGRCGARFNPSSLGAMCTSDAQCVGGRCLDGPGGYCALPGCRLSGDGPAEMCPANSKCIDDAAGDATLGVCVGTCTVGTDPDGGTGACRTGYECVPDAMGGTTGTCRAMAM